MFMLYVDESGDVGLVNSPTRYFILSGFVVHELRWHDTLDAIIGFRKDMRIRYGLKLREEIHAAHFIHDPKHKYRHIRRDLRLQILKEAADFQANLPDVSIINILVDKRGKPATYDVFNKAWMCMLQRFHNTISYRNFPGPSNPSDYGLAVVDRTDEVKLRNLSRRLRRHNLVPNTGGSGYRQMPLKLLVEDPVHRDSLHSYFIQLADVNSYMLKQQEQPCKYVRKKGGRKYFSRLDPVLCKKASRNDPQGVVRL